MPLIHDPTVRADLRNRVESLSPEAQRQWGKMTVDQMLWHCNRALEVALGSYRSEPGVGPPIPKGVLKFLVLRVPWPKGGPTAPDFMATSRHDFAAEKAKTLQLIDAICTREVASAWPASPSFGKMSGTEWSQLMAKHLDHHLRQFSA